jgi:hypothetical protein
VGVREVRRDKSDPPSAIFANLVNKNAIKPQKGVPSPKKIFHNLYPPFPKFGKKLKDPSPRFSNRVQLRLLLFLSQQISEITETGGHLIEFHLIESVDRIFRSNA